jgi:hypothetical protein
MKRLFNRANSEKSVKVDNCIKSAVCPIKWGVYQEGYWAARVLIVADRSDAEFERFTLHVIAHLSAAQREFAPCVGTQFEYLRRRGVMCSGMPRLMPDE